MTKRPHYFNIHFEIFENFTHRGDLSMEKADLELIEQLTDKDPELKKFWDEHNELERLVDEFNRRPYLTAAETMERKRLQKLKLAGREKMEQILAKYRQKEKAL